jgi:hypothetical protein
MPIPRRALLVDFQLQYALALDLPAVLPYYDENERPATAKGRRYV